MNMKKITNILICVLFLAAVFAVPVMFAVLPQNDFSELEKRYLAKKPEADMQSITDGSYMEELGEYIADHFPARNFFAGLNSYYDLWSGRQLTKDYISEDGRLYAKPVVADAETVSRNVKTVNRFADSLSTYGENGIPVDLMLVPSSGYVILGEDHGRLTFTDGEIMDTVYAGVKTGTVDLRDAFSAYPDKGELYYRTDHHWTSRGAYLAASLMARKEGHELPPEGSYNKESIEPFFGSEYSGSGLWLTEPDTIELWHSENKINAVNETGAKNDGVFYRNRLEELDKYTVFLDGNHAKVTLRNISKDPSGEGEDNLLVIRDSFSNSLGCFLADAYDKVVLIDLRYYKLPLTQIIDDERISEVLIEYSCENFVSDTNISFLQADEKEPVKKNYMAPPQELTDAFFNDAKAFYFGDSVVGPLYNYCVSHSKLKETYISSNAMYMYYTALYGGGKGQFLFKGQPADIRDVLRETGSEIFIGALGCNDLATYDVYQSEQTVTEFLNMLRAEFPDLTIFMQSVMPIKNVQADFNEAEVDEFNAWLKDHAEEYGYCYIELDKYFKGSKGTLANKYMYNETHIKNEAGDLWYKELMNIENYFNFPEKYYVEYDGETDLPVSVLEEAQLLQEAEKQRDRTILDNIYDEIRNRTGNADMLEIKDALISDYFGIEPGEYKDARFYVAGNNLKADEIWIVETSNEEAAESLLGKARERIGIKAETYKVYLPEEYEIAIRGTALRNGRFVGLFISKDPKQMSDVFVSMTGSGQ